MLDETNRRLARVVASYPIHLIVASVVVAALLSVSLLNCTVERDIKKSFSPVNSRADREERVRNEFLNISKAQERISLVFKAKDGGSMLRPSVIDEMYRIDGILNRYVMAEDDNKRRICDPLCDTNIPLDEFLWYWRQTKFQSNAIYGNNKMKIHLPFASINGSEMFIGLSMFGVDIVGSEIVKVTGLVRWYFTHVDTPEKKETIRRLCSSLYDLSLSHNASSLVDFAIVADEIANDEMIKGALQATKMMLMGVVLLVFFVFSVVWRKSNGWSVVWIAIVTIASPFLAVTMSFGVLTWLSFPVYSIMCITPFLLLGIGVDDSFILLQSWHHHRHVSDKKERLVTVFVEVGPSITITSVTNVIAFGVGYFTPTPQMSSFCLCTSIACFGDYLFTFTLVAPLIYTRTNDSKQSPVVFDIISYKPPNWCVAYSAFLCSWRGRVSTFLVLIGFYVFSSYGVLTMKSTFEPSKALPAESPLALSIGDLDYLFENYCPLEVIVGRAPNISDPNEYEQFYQMVSELEALPESYGREQTILWLKTYEKFDRDLFDIYHSVGFVSNSSYTPSYDNLYAFMDLFEYGAILHVKHDSFGNRYLSGFRMHLIARNMNEWSTRALYVDACRSIVDRYPQFNATVYDGESPILDLILIVKTDLLGSIIVTVFCMGVVCVFFLPSKLGIIIVVATIASICYTLVGSLSLWGADLDPVTMADVLMSTGFSVDYTAHIAYTFFRSCGDNQERIAHSLHKMCGPMIQAGISTVLCMLPVMFVSTYAIVTFAKTVFLVVGLGLLHGIYFLPCALASAPRHYYDTKGTNLRSSKNNGRPLLTEHSSREKL
ncbi:hypothetical protein AB6A40_000683 [Gnathostoma spinigerum]|uniref:SSD domain-containing protein n=1 Tax=Gnathostoma spinigerum TaxID=75299 RepID=A0ABD6E734_9BILA